PEYGRAAGGVVNIITRSGSNEFHGDVFGYLRNRNLQAVNPFSTVSNPAYTRAQGGIAFGGTRPDSRALPRPATCPTTNCRISIRPQRRVEASFPTWAPFKGRAIRPRS